VVALSPAEFCETLAGRSISEPNGTRTATASGALALVSFGMLLTPPARAQEGSYDGWRIQPGFAIAPVPLNLGKEHRSTCPSRLGQLSGERYWRLQRLSLPQRAAQLRQSKLQFNALFANVGQGTAYGAYLGPNIIARNPTPGKNGLPEGGHTLSQFIEILQTGADLDHIHPTCTSPTAGPGGTPAPPNCIPPPVNGEVLQVMPWPVFHNLSVSDITAIYEYLSTIPCIDNSTSVPPAGAPNELRNDCGGD
jgi:hypothetical protein